MRVDVAASLMAVVVEVVEECAYVFVWYGG